MVSTEKVRRSGQSISFTNYQQKPFQHVFIASPAEKLLHVYFNDVQINRVKFLTTPFLKNTSRRLLLKFIKYFSQNLFVSLDKFALLHCRYLMSKFNEMLILVCRKIFSSFQPILRVFPITMVSLFCKNLTLSILTQYFMIGNIFVQS